jgi:hypothetical protein
MKTISTMLATLSLTLCAAFAIPPSNTVYYVVQVDTNGVLVNAGTNLITRNGISTTGQVAQAIAACATTGRVSTIESNLLVIGGWTSSVPTMATVSNIVAGIGGANLGEVTNVVSGITSNVLRQGSVITKAEGLSADGCMVLTMVGDQWDGGFSPGFKFVIPEQGYGTAYTNALFVRFDGRLNKHIAPYGAELFFGVPGDVDGSGNQKNRVWGEWNTGWHTNTIVTGIETNSSGVVTNLLTEQQIYLGAP